MTNYSAGRVHQEIKIVPIGEYDTEELKGMPLNTYQHLLKEAVDEELEQAGGILETSLYQEIGEFEREMGSSTNPTLAREYADNHLDWAMQIRQATQYEWRVCFHIAGVFLYG